MKIEKENEPVSRKTFVAWGVGVLSVFSAARYFFKTTPSGVTTTVKMLTEDGRLVEVDENVLKAASTNKKASNKEIFDWMKNPSKA